MATRSKTTNPAPEDVAEQAPEATTEQTPGVQYIVKALQPTRGRAGETFTREERSLELTPEQVAEIEADPVLEIRPAKE